MTKQGFSFRGNGLVAIIVLILVFTGIFFLTKGVIWLLTLVAPVLLGLTALMDYKVIVNYVKWVGRQLNRDILWGLLVILLSVVAYPILFGILFFRAFVNWRVRSARKSAGEAREGEYAEYEELDSEPLPPLEEREAPRQAREERSDYDDLFR